MDVPKTAMMVCLLMQIYTNFMSFSRSPLSVWAHTREQSVTCRFCCFHLIIFGKLVILRGITRKLLLNKVKRINRFLALCKLPAPRIYLHWTETSYYSNYSEIGICLHSGNIHKWLFMCHSYRMMSTNFCVVHAWHASHQSRECSNIYAKSGI